MRWLPGSNGVDSYAINNLNQYTSITPAGQSAAAIVHDDNGNITTDHRGHTYTYDAVNTLRSVAGLSAGTATYAYNADGTRRSKTYNSVTASFYYDGDQEIIEYQASSVERRYIRLPGSVDEAFLMIDYTMDAGCTNTSYGNCEVWAHHNRLGSVIATSDDAGAVMDEYTYSPYGVSGGSTSGFPFRFTGQKIDDETGLYYYKARYYDPETGRFLQTDPIGYEDQMNLYAYVGNDPANAIDPSGTTTCKLKKGCGKIERAVEQIQTKISKYRNTIKDAKNGDAKAQQELLEDFGEGALDNLDEIDAKLAEISTAIEGATFVDADPAELRKKQKGGKVVGAYVNRENPGTFHVNSSLISEKSFFWQSVIAHEAAHSTGLEGHQWVRYEDGSLRDPAYGTKYAKLLAKQSGYATTSQNASNFACAVLEIRSSENC